MSTDRDELSTAVNAAEESSESHVLRAIGWLSAGMALAAISIFVGRELRSRYRFNHRTPYDFYDHVGDNEFGVGI